MTPLYRINDEVWHIAGNRNAIQTRISAINIKIVGLEKYRYTMNDGSNTAFMTGTGEYFEDEAIITYDLANDLKGYPEDSLFKTKEELINSL